MHSCTSKNEKCHRGGEFATKGQHRDRTSFGAPSNWEPHPSPLVADCFVLPRPTPSPSPSHRRKIHTLPTAYCNKSATDSGSHARPASPSYCACIEIPLACVSAARGVIWLQTRSRSTVTETRRCTEKLTDSTDGTNMKQALIKDCHSALWGKWHECWVMQPPGSPKLAVRNV